MSFLDIVIVPNVVRNLVLVQVVLEQLSEGSLYFLQLLVGEFDGVVGDVFADEIELVHLLIDLVVEDVLVLADGMEGFHVELIVADKGIQYVSSFFVELLLVLVQVFFDDFLIVTQSDFVQLGQGQLNAVFEFEGKEQILRDARARYLLGVNRVSLRNLGEGLYYAEVGNGVVAVSKQEPQYSIYHHDQTQERVEEGQEQDVKELNEAVENEAEGQSQRRQTLVPLDEN